jgi:hypothetical protein
MRLGFDKAWREEPVLLGGKIVNYIRLRENGSMYYITNVYATKREAFDRKNTYANRCEIYKIDDGRFAVFTQLGKDLGQVY